jgi:hypothetical protein
MENFRIVSDKFIVRERCLASMNAFIDKPVVKALKGGK